MYVSSLSSLWNRFPTPWQDSILLKPQHQECDSFLGHFVTVCVVCVRVTFTLIKRSCSFAEDCGTPWSMVVLWGLVSSNFFFSTGHQATVPNIRWDAGFVGLHGDHDCYVFPAVLITLNTFAAHVLSVVSLPLLLFWPQFRLDVLRTFDKSQKQKSSSGEFEFHEERDKLRSSLFKLTLSFLLFHLCKVCFLFHCRAMCNSGLSESHWRFRCCDRSQHQPPPPTGTERTASRPRHWHSAFESLVARHP